MFRHTNENRTARGSLSSIPTMMSDQSPNAIERGLDEECKEKADQQCGKQISPTKIGRQQSTCPAVKNAE